MEKKLVLITLALSYFVAMIAQADFDLIPRPNKPDKQPEIVKTLEERKIEAIRMEEEKRIEAKRNAERARIAEEKAKKEKLEKAKQMQLFYHKYGKKYVDAYNNEFKILIGTPEALITNELKAKLISEDKQTRVYDVYQLYGNFLKQDWKAWCRVDVDISTRKVRRVFYY